MCLLIFAHRVSPQFPLLVAANRDEFHARPTAISAFWEEYPDLLAGKDLEQGGTWMGVTRSGRFAAITNYRDPAQTLAAPRSRGELPLHYLIGSGGPQAFLETLAPEAKNYAGFNLLVGDRSALWYYSNSDSNAPQCLAPGIYGLSNASLDTPWPKVERGKAQLKELLLDGVVSHEALAALVADRRLEPTSTAPNQNPDNGMAAMLSAQFIVSETYGTRSSTTVWTETNGRTHWREVSFDAQGSRCAAQELIV